MGRASEDAADAEHLLPHGLPAKKSQPTHLIAPLLWTLGSCVFLAAAIVFSRARGSSQLVYSPAENAIKYKRTVYPDAFDHKNHHFMGEPSDFIDNNWSAMYDLTTKITKEQADQLEMPTIELPDDKGHYVVLLDIFHSLHCLNEVRKSLRPDYYAPYHVRMNTTEEGARAHLDHCVEHLRMALWCGADISPISFRYKTDGNPEGLSGYTHTCKDPVALIEWARENQLGRPVPSLP